MTSRRAICDPRSKISRRRSSGWMIGSRPAKFVPPDSDQSDATYNRMLSPRFDRRFCLAAGDYGSIAPMIGIGGHLAVPPLPHGGECPLPMPHTHARGKPRLLQVRAPVTDPHGNPLRYSHRAGPVRANRARRGWGCENMGAMRTTRRPLTRAREDRLPLAPDRSVLRRALSPVSLRWATHPTR
jgi:hypothetical protein